MAALRGAVRSTSAEDLASWRVETRAWEQIEG